MKSQKWLVFKVFLNSVQIKVSFQFEIIILSSENCNLEKKSMEANKLSNSSLDMLNHAYPQICRNI